MSNLSLRLIFGALYVALFVAVTYSGGLAFGLLMAGVSFLALHEMAKLSQRDNNQLVWVNPLLFAGIIVYGTLFDIRLLNTQHYIIAWVAQLATVVGVYWVLKKTDKVQYSLASLYIWLPLAAMAFWYQQAINILAVTLIIKYILFFFLTIWVYDSMAYVVGRTVGKHPIFPKVSPKKTIEGAVGGAACAIAIMWALNTAWMKIPTSAIVMSSVIVVFATFGDYVESYVKRKMGVKDSGNIIPGHGGILDRIDSILLASLPYLVIISVL